MRQFGAGVLGLSGTPEQGLTTSGTSSIDRYLHATKTPSGTKRVLHNALVFDQCDNALQFGERVFLGKNQTRVVEELREDPTGERVALSGLYCETRRRSHICNHAHF